MEKTLTSQLILDTFIQLFLNPAIHEWNFFFFVTNWNFKVEICTGILGYYGHQSTICDSPFPTFTECGWAPETEEWDMTGGLWEVRAGLWPTSPQAWTRLLKGNAFKGLSTLWISLSITQPGERVDGLGNIAICRITTKRRDKQNQRKTKTGVEDFNELSLQELSLIAIIWIKLHLNIQTTRISPLRQAELP